MWETGYAVLPSADIYEQFKAIKARRVVRRAQERTRVSVPRGFRVTFPDGLAVCFAACAGLLASWLLPSHAWAQALGASSTQASPVLAVWERAGVPPVVVHASGEVFWGQLPLFALSKDEKAVREKGQWRVWLNNPRKGHWHYVDARGRTVLTHDNRRTLSVCGVEDSPSDSLHFGVDGTVTRGERKLGAWTWYQTDGLSRSATVLVTFLILNWEASGGRSITPPCDLIQARRVQVAGASLFAVGYVPMLLVATQSKDLRHVIPVAGPFFGHPRYRAYSGWTERLSQLAIWGLATSSSLLQLGGMIVFPLALLDEHHIKQRQSVEDMDRAGAWPKVWLTGSTVQLSWSY